MHEHFAIHVSAYVRLTPNARASTALGKCRHVGGLTKSSLKILSENFSSSAFLKIRSRPTNRRHAGTMKSTTRASGSPPSGILGALTGAWT